MRTAKTQASLYIFAVLPELLLFAHTEKNASLSNTYFYLKLLKMFTGVTKKITKELL